MLGGAVIGGELAHELGQLFFCQGGPVLDGARLENLRGHEIEHGIGVDSLVRDGPAIDGLHALKHPACLVGCATGFHLFDGFHDLAGF